MPGTQYFLDKQKNSLNSFTNGDALKSWEPDSKYIIEVKETLKRSQMDLEEGILLKYKVLRMRQLEQSISENCYGDSKLNMHEAEMCQNFHIENDYKLKIMDGFWKDHIPKHVKGYQSCMNGIDKIETVVEKDKAFADCHKQWMKDWKQNKS